MNNSIEEAFTTIGEFLEDDGWFPQKVEAHLAYKSRYSGRNSYVDIYVHVRDKIEQVICYGVAPFRIPEQKRSLVAELFCRANYTLSLGNLEMDFDDGEVRYRTYIDFEDMTLQPKTIQNILYSSVRGMDRFIPCILAIIEQGVLPEKALEIAN